MEWPKQQEHGCRPVAYNNYLPKSKQGGGGFRRAQTAGNNADKNRCPSWLAILCRYTFGFLIIIAACAGWFLWCTHSPYFECKLNSFSFVVSRANSSTTTCDAVFSVQMVTIYDDSLHNVSTAKASVFYRDQRLSDICMDSFGRIGKKEEIIRLNFTATTLPEKIAAEMASEKAENGTLSLGFLLEAVGYVGLLKGMFEISVKQFQVGFSSDSAAGQLMHGSIECRSRFLNRVHQPF